MVSVSRQPRALLIQIREKPDVRQEEFEGFVRYSGLNENSFHSLNVYDTPHFAADIGAGYDAVFVGGASSANVLQPQKYSFVEDLQDLLLNCIERKQPVFASCFGFQLAVLALGGEIFHEDEDYEMGSIPIYLRETATTDLLFGDVPNPFMAVSVHQQSALKAPPRCVELAYTEKCCHAFKVIDAPFWAFQFHPEVDKRILISRLTVYKQRYTRDDVHLDEVLAEACEVPEANDLLHKFVQRVLY